MKISLISIFVILFSICKTGQNSNKEQAKNILNGPSLTVVDTMARSLLMKGCNVGIGYSQVWARDMNTFIETAFQEVNPEEIRGRSWYFCPSNTQQRDD